MGSCSTHSVSITVLKMVATRLGLAFLASATVMLAGAGRQKRSRIDNYYLKKPIAPSDFYETPQFGMAGHAPYNQKMKYYDPGWQLRYQQWLASQAAFGFPFRVRGPTVYDKNKAEMKELLGKGMYHAYNSLRTKGNSLWKQYGYALYGNSWIHGYPGFYGLGLNALSRLASKGPFGAYPYGGGYGGYGGYKSYYPVMGRNKYGGYGVGRNKNGGYGAGEMKSKQRYRRSTYGNNYGNAGRYGYGGYGGYGFGGYGNFPWTGNMFYSKNFDYTAYNMGNLMKR